ncbi:S8 family serine peptidase [Paracerasibacillus soli]|uniref:S8 family serine peptidase n=1 Tax=Paracerasibacillus soli TaxID=480284 RepID=A0ABU5CST9_9BACI|nr:S8 family serine peptidase [Virgibacillus soli]MDY0409446.1 S8 family serine peptidase [Virgibacillus soli]
MAGTIAAIGANEYGIKGIAPKVDLYAYRVLGAYGSGSTSWVIGGIEQSVEDGMDVINLSLGGGANSETDPSSIAADNATISGVTVVSATGNSGPGRGTIGSPASSPLGIAVGNTTLPEVLYAASVHVEAGDYTNESNIALMSFTFGTNPADVLTGEYDLVAVPGVGEAKDFEGLDVDGKVALISRGDIPFVDKIYAAKDAGAVATIIHNNTGSGPANVNLGDSFDFLPAFDMSTEEGEALRNALESHVGKVSFSNFDESLTEGDTVNDSSSRGPTKPNFDIKPDVVAPGTNIMSTIPAYQRDYPNASYEKAFDRKTGTSMAAPHVAGIAALLKAENPDWRPEDIKVALSNTAKVLDTNKFDVFAQGPGLVQPVKALSAKALAYAKDSRVVEGNEVNYGKGTVTFGNVLPGDAAQTVTKEIEVKGSGTYNVEVEVTKGASGTDVTVDKSSFTLNGTELLEVSLTVGAEGEVSGDEIFGYIHINGDGTELSLPYAAKLSEDNAYGLEYYFLDDYAISPNGDGKHDVTNLNLGLLHDEDQMTIELWDMANPDGGAWGDGYIGLLAAQGLSAGYYTLTIDGTYVDWFDFILGNNVEKPIPEGVYTVDYNSWGENIDLLGSDGPFYVKTSEPVIDLQASDVNVLNGSVTDKFIDFKSVVEAYELPYDVNEKLITTYDVADAEGNVVVENERVTLNQDGSFTIDLANLENGEYSVTVDVEDIVANGAAESVNVVVEGEEPEEPEEPGEPENQKFQKKLIFH